MQTLLLVEDNPDDQFIMKRALKSAGVLNPLHILDDGQLAIDYLEGVGVYCDRSKYPLPALIFLDLNLPFKSGFDVLKWVRARAEFKGIVIVVLTSSEHLVDISAAYQAGANSYLVKPPRAEDLMEMAKSFKWYWMIYNRFETVPSL
ncbi:MAG: putative response regulator, CheY [Verrucomicrobiales bacterium]|nr:putative response regulator, CheY [Verrucomicrobiales bacterium]MDB6130069.1 putative response regulator, CheY [Verrucomicrobiales bacterium]